MSKQTATVAHIQRVDAGERAPRAACSVSGRSTLPSARMRSAMPIGGRAGSARAAPRIERVDLAAVVAADLQHVLEACGRDQHAFRQLALEHGVGGDGGAVQQVADVGQREAVAAPPPL